MKNLNFLSNQSDFGLENGSGMTREWLGIDSTVSRKLFTLLFVLLLGFGQMWGATETVTISTIASANSWTNGNHYSGWTSSSGKFTFTASNTGQGLYYSSDNSWRGYKSKGSMVITAGSGITISSVTSSATASWSVATGGGSASFTPTATIKFTSFTITYTEAASKTLSSISVQTAPTKKKYVAGETFDPTGLIITRTYSDKTSDTYAYAGHTSDFTFSPTTSASLTTSNTSVSITYGGKSTSQSINVYNVTMQARDEEGNTIPSGGPGAPSRTGNSISPANDANNYVFKQWQVTNAELGSSASTKVNTITNPSNAVTVTAVYHKPITITYKANGQDFTTQTYGYGGTLAFPASEPDGDDYSCTGKTFTGWVAEANKDYKHASTAPTYATASGSVTTEATYYAVFADASGSGSDKYKVTTSLSVGKTYVMGAVKASASTTLANNTAIGAITFSTTYSSTSWGQCTSVTPNASGEIAANSVTDAMKWTLESITSGKYAFKKGNNYMYLKASSTGSNTCGLNTSANVYLENATSTCKDAFLMHPQSGTGGNRAMLNGSSGYRIYGTNTAASSSMCPYVRFYEYTPGVTYSNYATTCCQPLVSINGSFNRYHLKIFHHIIMSMFISLIFKC